MIRALCLTTAVLFTACSASEPTEAPTPVEATTPFPVTDLWDINYDQSYLRFSGSQESTPFTGEFERYTVQVSLDPDAPEAGRISVTIEMDSAQSGDAERDSALPGKDWFHTARHPVATFSSQSIRKTGDSNYVAEGDLRIKGTTIPISLPFILDVNDNNASATGRIELNRSEFSVGSGNYATDQWIAFPVNVEFSLTATKV